MGTIVGKVRHLVVSIGLASLASACSASNATAPADRTCSGPGSLPIDSACLVFQDQGELDQFRTDIGHEIRRGVDAVRTLLPIDGVIIRVVASSELVIPELGMSGRASRGDEVRLAFDPRSPVLDASLQTALFPMLAHELHHIARQRTVGYGADLLGAMVSEGLADHFSLEVAGGSPPPWSTALTDSELAEWSARAETEWFDTGYDHDRWFLGADPEVPRWAGYAIGFSLVGEYLAGQPGRSASAMYDAPRQAFVAD